VVRRKSGLLGGRYEIYLLLCLCCIVHRPCGFNVSESDVLTYHNDNTRSGLNPSEFILTTSNVNTNTFGLLHNLLVNGRVYAQPLYVASQPIYVGGVYQGRHNALYVGTDHDALYCFDADSGALLW
jgi:outer membrane protein assembly factor BamB